MEEDWAQNDSVTIPTVIWREVLNYLSYANQFQHELTWYPLRRAIHDPDISLKWNGPEEKASQCYEDLAFHHKLDPVLDREEVLRRWITTNDSYPKLFMKDLIEFRRVSHDLVALLKFVLPNLTTRLDQYDVNFTGIFHASESSEWRMLVEKTRDHYASKWRHTADHKSLIDPLEGKPEEQ